jgi:very-short-patch-repair endonuclease
MLRATATEDEQRLWALLRNRRFQGYKFLRQVSVGPYTVDFLCRSARLVVELDGSQHAESAHDRVRDKYLAARGFKVLRIWNHDFRTDRMSVMETIFAALEDPKGPSPGSDPVGPEPPSPRVAGRGMQHRCPGRMLKT